MTDATTKTFAVTITGKTRMLRHRFTDAAQMAATDGTRSAAAAGDRGTPMEQAEASLYKDEQGRIVFPGPNLFRCLIEAGKFFKAGKSKITTQKTSMIPACLSVVDLIIPIQHNEPWTVDARPVRIPSTGVRIIRYRPCFHDWTMTFELELDTSMLTEKLLRSIVDAAGSRIGLGDFRPDCKGPFGKFVVTEWKPL